ncbi:MAG: metallophosphoesterase [Zoogloeaceae bacterium]|jgi:predicted MPP superfamily phosphohydrolase|nr:metallophosphoesterase [Zoogloeaceae bacterium]
MSGFHIFTLIKWLYAALNAGLIARLWLILSASGASRFTRWGSIGAAVFCSLAMPVARSLEGNGFWLKTLTFIGTAWLAFVLHVLLLWGVLDVFLLCGRRFGWASIQPEARAIWRARCCAGVAGFSLLLCLLAWINTQSLTTREVSLPAPEFWKGRPLVIAALSDLHLGRSASPEFLRKVVEQIAAAKPDIALIAGDILEYDFDAEDLPAVRAAFARLKLPLGLWGVPGNHEYIGGRGEISKRFLEEAGIRLLADRWVTLDGGAGKILLIGRDDRSVARKTLPELLRDAPEGDFLRILVEHQPFHLEDAEDAGVHLQISGHTHNGQLFPFNWLVAAIYENAHGYSRRGETQYWVTSGAGTWGPRMRTTGRPEIVRIELIPRG